MRVLIASLLLLYSATSYGAGMVAVAEKDRYCAGKASYCYEWQLTSDASIRFIAWGDEDGIDYSFYHKSPTGKYQHLIRVFPALSDSSKPQSLYWGYPWDIEDIALDQHHPGALLATFKHQLIDDGEVYSPSWQKKIPAVLFIGHTTQPDITVPRLHFLPTSLPTLRKQGSNKSFKPNPLRGSA